MALRVAVLLDNTLVTDRRAVLEIKSLKSLPIELFLYCLSDDQLLQESKEDNLTIRRVIPPDYWAFSNRRKLEEFALKIAKEKFDVLHCHDQYMLHVGAIVKSMCPGTILIYESRELFHSWPVNYSNQSIINQLKSYIVRYYEMRREKRNGQKIEYLITVNDSIAAILKKYFKLKSDPIVTRNIPSFKELPNKTDQTLRQKFNIPANDCAIVYIGVNVYRYTNLMENFVDAIGQMPNVHLIIITRRNERRIWFENYVDKCGYKNIYFHDLIPVNTIEETISCCDIGLVTAWYKMKLSYWLALDNKLFTYIMSEIPILGTAQPEYEKVINNHDVGVCINPEKINTIQSAIHNLIANKERYKQNCRIAKKELCWDVEQKKLLSLYQTIINNKTTHNA